MSNLFAEAEDFVDAHYRLIALNAIIDGKKCDCLDPDCPAVGKHPKKKSWQTQEHVGEETLKIWNENYHCNGLGWALDEDHIVIDVDRRSGGIESLEMLQNDLAIDLFDRCSAIVKTGGNGWHFYFKKDVAVNIGWKMPKKYPGIDIKQFGGFVVIPGSLHATGNYYEWHSFQKSELLHMSILPSGIAEMLTKTYTIHRESAKLNGEADLDEISDMLTVLSADMPYDEWTRVGMSIHNATDGDDKGLHVWEKWSRTSGKWKDGITSKKWFSFGKYVGDSVGIGSLVKMAQECGWVATSDTSFLSEDELKAIKESWDKKKDRRIDLPSVLEDADIDLFEPRGLLGEIYDYIYACSPYPNKTLTLACSLSTLTNVIGRRYYWPGKFSNIQPNLLVLCVAGSSVGKDSLIKAAHRILSICKLAPAIHGRIKSDKDLIDAMERNQYAIYYIDEFGYVLQRINNAIKKGGASYLEGITSTIMEAFTKGDSELLLDLSRKAALRERYEIIIATCQKQLVDGNFPSTEAKTKAKLARAEQLMDMHATGLPNPFLSIFTTATPKSMESAFSGDATENGFLSRAMAFHEFETNPRRKEDFAGTPVMPQNLEWKLRSVSVGSHLDECPFGRVDSFDLDRVALKIENEAQVFVERALDYFHELAETQKESGLESLPRRALDGIVKVCIALASENGTLTLQMARYAVKLVKMEIDRKIRRVNSTERMASKDSGERMDGVSARILEVCNTEKGETPAVILCHVKSGRVNRVILDQIISSLVEKSYLEEIDQGRKYGGIQLFRYKTKEQN